jgi:DNA-binding response OmpR family regulator
MKLLIVEDEISLLNSIKDYFEESDFLCEGVQTYRDAISKIEDFTYDCIILDINLPDGNGLKLLSYLRGDKKNDGVIIISARNSLDDKITGFNYGADDYLVKPFHLSELNVRLKALLRRKYTQGATYLEAGNLKLNLASREATCNNFPLTLTKNEFDLLLYLLNNKNTVVSKQAIAEHLYGEQSDNLPSFDFVYSQIKNLKRKLKDKGGNEFIQSVYGLGYKLSV